LLGYAELMTTNVLKHVARRLIARCVQRSVARAAQAPASR